MDQDLTKVIEERIKESLYHFMLNCPYLKVSVESEHAIRNVVMDALHALLADRLITVLPLVDVNHREELAYLKTKMFGLEQQYSLLPCGMEAIQVMNEMSMLQYRIDFLKSQIKDLHSPQIFFKNADFSTFTDWEKY